MAVSIGAHLRQPAVAVELREVAAFQRYAAVGRQQLPAVARDAVVQVDAAAAAEAVTGELRQQLLGLLDDLRMPARRQRRVDQLRVLGPEPPHRVAAALAVGVGVGRQVVVDQALDVAHGFCAKGGWVSDVRPAHVVRP